MKTGFQTVQDMAAELSRRASSKRDFVVSTELMSTEPYGDGISLNIGRPGNDNSVVGLNINQHAHRQIGSHFKVPAQFYDRMRGSHPDLLSSLLNGLFEREPSNRMVRTLDGTARAFLSDRYRALDNEDLAEVALPILSEAPDLMIASTQITETRFYIKAVFPRIQTEVKPGDPVQSGIVISNSEVGDGALSVAPLIFRLVCKNGMIASSFGSRTYHVGRKVGSLDDGYQVFRDQTREADDKALWMKLQDVLHAAVHDAEAFGLVVDTLREATEKRIEGKVSAVVEVTAKKFGYTETQQESILEHLLRGGDLTQYGLMNAITRTSQDVEDYDIATAMERDGGQLIELPRKDWEEIAQAA